MRRFIFVILVVPLTTHHVFAFGALVCGQHPWVCAISSNAATPDDALMKAEDSYSEKYGANGCCHAPIQFFNECFAAAAGPTTGIIFADKIPSLLATKPLLDACNKRDGNCRILAATCDVTSSLQPSSFFQFDALGTAISAAIGALFILLIYAMRAPIANYIIHGNLPQKLPVYGEDIQCLFTRTQRVNWYGRTVFGVVVNLAMTHQQLINVRKYWLGRVIAFDSLRRQRQNELARMHLQLAASVTPESKDKKPLSQLLVALKTIFFVIFYLVRALFNFLLGFMFIRITIAKLVRGTIIESHNLVLILQAKEAIEQSATYLKEYLGTADSFDGRDEVYEPE